MSSWHSVSAHRIDKPMHSYCSQLSIADLKVCITGSRFDQSNLTMLTDFNIDMSRE